MRSGAAVLIRRSHFYGNHVPLGSAIAVLNPGSSIKVENSIIANTTSDGVGVIYDATGEPFAVALDTVSFARTHARAAIYSMSEILAQNCDGLESADVFNVSVGSCATTGDYCMPQARTRALTHIPHSRGNGGRRARTRPSARNVIAGRTE